MTKTKKTAKYINRDIAWLSFNDRVLQEATDKKNPLYERLKFLAIFSSNLDEFFKVRVSQLRQIKMVAKGVRKPLALKPNKTLKIILKKVTEQQERFGNIYYQEILPELAANGINIINSDKFSKSQQNFCNDFFKTKVKGKLKTCLLENISSFNFEDGKLYLAVAFETNTMGFVSIPTEDLGRFIPIPSGKETHVCTFLEEVIRFNLALLFPDKKITGSYSIKISRDAELYLDDEYDGALAQQIYQSLSKRQEGQPTRLLYDNSMPDRVLHLLKKELNLGDADLVPGGKHHRFSDFFGFPAPSDKPELQYVPMPPLSHKSFENSTDYFELICNKDQILHFPYQSFSYLQNFILTAAHDPKVSAIKISLYRIAKQSELTDALLVALKNKKKVTIFVEAQARFDEANNLEWGKVFEAHGATVLYSIPNIKVHSKILLVERRENEGLNRYCYIGTGNFNAKTAKLYGDYGLFTANTDITNDLNQVFEVLERNLIIPKVKKLLVSPFTTRNKLEGMIQREIDYANDGMPAKITLKMNSLEDKRMISYLYRASEAGVKINLIVRGFCCLVAGVKGVSENINVISIVDRFLEHGRIYLFHNKGNEEMFIGSADWMVRNLDKRIEVLTPILDQDIFDELKTILNLQLNDTVKARKIAGDEENSYITTTTANKTAIRSQYATYEYLKKWTIS